VQVAGGIAGGLMVLAAVAMGPRIGVKLWRDPAYADQMTRSGRVLPFSYATSRGVTRGSVPLWVGVGFIGAGTIAASALPTGTSHHASTALIAALVCYAIGLAAIALNVSIVWFNRPRGLVPPPMRGEEGLVTAWWRSRDLPPAQRRAAACARRTWPALDRPAPTAHRRGSG
jgi:hypothetical protein